MERVDGYRSNSQLYIYNGFIYGLTVRGVRYFGCRYRQACPGRVIIRNGIPEITQAHNHDADEAEAEMLRFKSVLRRRARTENTSLATIFREEERRHPLAATLIAGLGSVRSTMVRSRAQGTPRIPISLTEYSQFIREKE